MIRITREQFSALKWNNSENRMTMFDQAESIDLKQALDRGLSIDEALLIVRNLGMERECVQFALGCSRAIEHMFPDHLVIATNDATQRWLDNPCEETGNAAREEARNVWKAIKPRRFYNREMVILETHVFHAVSSAAFATFHASRFSARRGNDVVGDVLIVAGNTEHADPSLDLKAILISAFSQQFVD